MVDLFSGIGGWVEGYRLAGGGDSLGVELDRHALASARRAGHPTLHGDVADIDPRSWWGVEGLVASPPCQTFSHAGRGAGRAAFVELALAIRDAFASRRTRGLRTRRVARLLATRPDERTSMLSREERARLARANARNAMLVVEPARWARALLPRFVALEQVPPVLPLWELYAHELRELGYRSWAGTLNAADYGLPQTRTRAILLATRDERLRMPEPTHAREGSPTDLFGRERARWVSMSDALGWGLIDAPAGAILGTSRGGGHGLDGGAHSRARYRRAREEGRWALHTNRDQREDGSRQVCELDVPAPALTAKSGGQWEFVQGKRSNATRRARDEPAPTMLFAKDFASKGFVGPGGSLRLEIEQGLVLQGFARDYPVTGSVTARWRQIGNAFPPPMACALLRALAPREEP